MADDVCYTQGQAASNPASAPAPELELLGYLEEDVYEKPKDAASQPVPKRMLVVMLRLPRQRLNPSPQEFEVMQAEEARRRPAFDESEARRAAFNQRGSSQPASHIAPPPAPTRESTLVFAPEKFLLQLPSYKVVPAVALKDWRSGEPGPGMLSRVTLSSAKGAQDLDAVYGFPVCWVLNPPECVMPMRVKFQELSADVPGKKMTAQEMVKLSSIHMDIPAFTMPPIDIKIPQIKVPDIGKFQSPSLPPELLRPPKIDIPKFDPPKLPPMPPSMNPPRPTPVNPPPSTPSNKSQAQVWLEVADNFAANQKPDKAQEYLRKVIDTYPNTEWAKTAEKKLAELKNKPSP